MTIICSHHVCVWNWSEAGDVDVCLHLSYPVWIRDNKESKERVKSLNMRLFLHMMYHNLIRVVDKGGSLFCDTQAKSWVWMPNMMPEEAGIVRAEPVAYWIWNLSCTHVLYLCFGSQTLTLMLRLVAIQQQSRRRRRISGKCTMVETTLLCRG